MALALGQSEVTIQGDPAKRSRRSLVGRSAAHCRLSLIGGLAMYSELGRPMLDNDAHVWIAP